MAMQPTATGSLDKTPFAHLLVYSEQRSLSGTLVVWPDGASDASQGQDRILLSRGQPVAARLYGSASDLSSGLLPLFGRRSAPYAFYEADLVGDASGRLEGPLDSWALMATWLRGDDVYDDVVVATLARLGEYALSLASNAALARFGFLPAELALVERVGQSPASISELSRGGELPRTRALRTLYLLVITKVAVPVPLAATVVASKVPASQPASPAPALPVASPTAATRPASPQPPTASSAPARPAVAPTRSASPAPTSPTRTSSPTRASSQRLISIPAPEPELSDEHRKRWLHVMDVAKRIEHQNYFEMLGIEKTAKTNEIRAAFLQMAKDWHPDRLPKELSALRPYVEIVFGYISEAHTTLSDDKQRLPYIQSVRDGGGTPEADRLMQRIVDSAMQYERVLIYSRRRDYRAALDLLEQILVATPDEPDYQAMYAWLLMQLHPPTPESTPPYSKMLAAVDKALGLHEGHEKAHLYKAQILKSMGKTREALEGFHRVVEINPNNVDASREVRIAQMRADSRRPGAKKPEPSGLLGKLFKKP